MDIFAAYKAAALRDFEKTSAIAQVQSDDPVPLSDLVLQLALAHPSQAALLEAKSECEALDTSISGLDFAYSMHAHCAVDLDESTVSLRAGEPLYPLLLDATGPSNALLSIAATLDVQPSTAAFTFVHTCFAMLGNMAEAEVCVWNRAVRADVCAGGERGQGVDEESAGIRVLRSALAKRGHCAPRRGH